MIPGLSIRNATMQDAEFVFHWLCTLEEKQLDKHDFLKIYSENLSHDSNIYLLAEYYDKQVGFISLHSQKLLHHCGLVGEIQELFVEEPFRSNGVGAQLICSLEKIAAENGILEIEVTSNAKRKKAHLFYKNMGYSQTHLKFSKKILKY